MRDIVEIGIGRAARRSYGLAEISIIPSRRTRSSRDIDLTWDIDAYNFRIPFMSSPSDALASEEFITEFDRLGGMAVINAEGLWGRATDLHAAAEQVINSANPVATLQQLHAVPLDLDLLSSRIARVRASGATVAVRVSPQHARELAPVLVKAGAELLIIQGTIISAEHVQGDGEPLNLKEFVGSLDVPVIAGGVYDYTTALHLMRAGVVGVIVGSGESTSFEALGVGVGTATAIADAAAARRDYLDETGGRYVHIIADAPDIISSGAIALAIACGADAVVVGRLLASAKESLGQGAYWESVAGHPRFPRSTVTTPLEFGDEPVELASLETIIEGPSTNPFGQANLAGGLRRALAKCGYTDLKSFRKVELALNLF